MTADIRKGDCTTEHQPVLVQTVDIYSSPSKTLSMVVTNADDELMTNDLRAI